MPALRSTRTRGVILDELDGSCAPDLDGCLARARAGDEAAFAQLWRAHHPPLLRYLTVRGDRAPEDVAAETWMQVVKGLAGFEGDVAQFRGWLFTIARHRAVDAGRARARRPAVSVADPTEVGTPATTPSPEEIVGEAEATREALDLVATLPPDQAEMVMLRVVAGLAVAEVAEVMDKPPGTVRVSVHRALKKLARDPRVRRTASARKVV